jgi:hypothetical protein
MLNNKVTLKGDLHFKLRFNTMHGDTDFYWRVIIDDEEYLVKSIHCKVETWSDASFDTRANAIKYNMTGKCREFYVDDDGKGILYNPVEEITLY